MPPAADALYERRWWTLAVLCLSLLMIIVGNTVLNVAIPTLIRDIGATNSQLQWIVDAYSLVFAGLLLTAGALGDRYGRKGALNIGLLVFGAGSLAAALSDTPSQLIACRAVMGVGAALVMPATLSLLASVFPPRERARAIAIWAGVAGMAVALGPIVGGWLLVHFWWGSVFLINLPVVALALVAVRFLVPTSRDPGRTPLDPAGSALSIAGLLLILYGIIEAPIRGWGDSLILGAFGLGLAVFVVFAVWELRAAHPMLDLRAFRRPALTGGSLAISLVFFAMFGTFFMLTQYFQIVHGYTPLGAGVRLLPMAIAMLVVSPSSARLAERLGTKAVVTTGLVIVAVGLSIFSRVHAGTSYLEIGLVLGFLAVGMGMTMPPSTSAIMSSLPMAKAGVGSAINDTTRELGGALGVAVLGSVLNSQYKAGLGPLARQLPGGARQAALASVGGAVRVSQQVGGRAGATLANVARHAFTDAMGTALLVAAGVALTAAGLIAWVMPRDVVYEEEPAVAAGGAETEAEEPAFADD